jgi:hypothetical protein
MKVLLFGDGPALKDKGKALREQNGWTVHLRTAARWAGEVETVDAVYFLAPADAIRAAYRERGIECYLVEETREAENAADGNSAQTDDHTPPAETGGGEAFGNAVTATSPATTDTPPPGADGQGAPATPNSEKPADTPPRTPAPRPAAAYKPKPGGPVARKAR